MSPARRKDGEGELLGQLEQLAELTPSEAAGDHREVVPAQQVAPARRGRPKGAKTKADTSGVKLAREYLHLLAEGLRPTAAFREVGRRFKRPHMHETACRKALDRHYDRLIEEGGRLVHLAAEQLGRNQFDPQTENSLREAIETEREYREDVSGLADVEQTIAAMSRLRAWLGELLGDSVSREELVERVAKLKSQTEIRAVLEDYAQTVLQELRRRAVEEVKRILAEEPTSTACPDIPNGGLEYWRVFILGVSNGSKSVDA
ncbi:MAG: hypothetical protein IT511_00300 [Rhodocyclaceae bacterium]|nr:hypothetical protein [Rhodocyclaceae bacterium]